MQKTIKWYSKSVYGNTLNYLADPRLAIIWYNMTGRKTIDRQDMRWMEEMFGAKFERVFDPVEAA